MNAVIISQRIFLKKKTQLRGKDCHMPGNEIALK